MRASFDASATLHAFQIPYRAYVQNAARTNEDIPLCRELADVGAALHAVNELHREVGPEHVRAKVAALWRIEAPVVAQHVGLPHAQQ